MFPFPGLDRRSEPVLPAHVQDPSDLAAQGLQLRFGGRPGWEIVEVAHLSRQRRGRPANLPDERTQGGHVIVEPVPSKAARLFASEARQAVQGLRDFRPCGQGRQANGIEVPWSEASAVPRPRSTIERGSEAEERPGCIIPHRPTRRHLVGNGSRVKTVSRNLLERPGVRDVKDERRQTDAEGDDDPRGHFEGLLVLLVEVPDEARRRMETRVAVSCHCVPDSRRNLGLKTFSSPALEPGSTSEED